MHSEAREHELVEAVSNAYARDEISLDEFETDIGLVLDGELPTHCKSYSVFAAPTMEKVMKG
jgi:hypothetical protein